MNPPNPRHPPVRLENTTPILRVSHLAGSVDYYTTVLGFSVDWIVPDNMGSVSRDGHGLMLCLNDQGQAGTWVWCGVSDVESLWQEYRSAGAIIRLPPTNYSWAREIHVQDPDGHVLRFGSEPLEDQPIVDWVAWYADGT